MTTYTTVLPDGTHILLTVWTDGTHEIATREDPWDTWSAPVELQRRGVAA